MSKDPDTSIGGRHASEDIGIARGALNVCAPIETRALRPMAPPFTDAASAVSDPYDTHPP